MLNVALTAPYFHNGGQKSLEEVVAFYNRGGDVRRDCDDSSLDITATNGYCNKDPDITSLGLSQDDQDDLVAFLKTLTAEQVRCESAPFDHPSLIVSHGNGAADTDGDSRADDVEITIAAVGAGGLAIGKDTSACHVNSGNLFE